MLRNLRWRFYRKTGGPRNVGNRCKTYCPGCIVCATYRLFYLTGGFPTWQQAHRESQDQAEANPDLRETPWKEIVP